MKLKARRTEDFSEFYGLEATPHYQLVPKQLESNLKFRKKLLNLTKTDRRAQNEVRGMCAADLLFYINAFCYTLSPKDYPDSPDRPFITYPYQDRLLLEALDCLGKQDLVIPKSRDMGITWIFMCLLEWLWHFRPRQQLMMISRKQELVDVRGDPGTLFGKVDYLHEFMPKWLLPKGRELGDEDPNRRLMYLKNADNGSLLSGESTVPDLGRAKRFVLIFMDEHASLPRAQEISRATQQATDCRISVSTPKGTGGDGEEFYRWTQSEAAKVLRCHWSEHPEKSVGLYEFDLEADRLKVYDPDYHYAQDFNFVKDGKLRSPWYDYQCVRAISEKDVEQEIDINFLGSGSAFFKADRIEKLKLNTRPPVFVGDLSCDDSLMEIAFINSDHGHLFIWEKPRQNHTYVLGADVATGSGGDESSNSVASILDVTTGIKVAEYACYTILPPQFATLVVALCKYYGDARLIWEVNGPGASFGRKIIDELHYPYLYYRRNFDSILSKASNLPGFHSNQNTKRILLSEYADALYTAKYSNPSERALNECLQYTIQLNGKIEHEGSRSRMNEHSYGPNHGDRVIADALSWQLGKDTMEKVEPADISDLEAPVGSFAWRRQQWRDRSRASTKKSRWA